MLVVAVVLIILAQALHLVELVVVEMVLLGPVTLVQERLVTELLD